MGKDVPRVVSQGQQSHVDRRKHAAFIQQHLCQTGFGITETFRHITEACARRDKKKKPSRTAAPPPFTFVSGRTASGLPEGLAAPGQRPEQSVPCLKMSSYPDASIPCWGRRKQGTLQKKERGRKENLPCCLKRKHSWNASRGGDILDLLSQPQTE